MWRPFQLNPDMPNEGMERQQYLEVKFGGKQKAKDMYQSIYNAGRENNIHLRFFPETLISRRKSYFPAITSRNP